MECKKVHSIYFSPATTTRKTIEILTENLPGEKNAYDLGGAEPDSTVVNLGANDLAVVGMPVYAGRIPPVAVGRLKRFKGERTPAIVVAVYGNRDYDDALRELKDLMESQGFVVVSAGAFIARHSIFPQVAEHRPDDRDRAALRDFAARSLKKLADLAEGETPLFDVTGRFPYKEPKAVPLVPVTDGKCNACGICVLQCPVAAIDRETPSRTDKTKCVACAACIYACPQQARKFGGLLYSLGGFLFKRKFSRRREPETFM